MKAAAAPRAPVHESIPVRLKFHLRWLGPMAPALTIIALFFLAPIAWTFYIAFTNMELTGATATNYSFVGLQNFRHMFSDSGFRNSVGLTLIFTLGSAVIGQGGLGLLLAILMRGKNGVFRAVLGAIVVGAWVVPEIVAAFIWYAFLNKEGSLNVFLGALHLPQSNWLYAAPMISVILANVWRGSAFSMLVFSAAISDVPQDVLEAASIDGAGPLQRLVRITLPLIKNSIMTNFILITLQTLALFTLIFAMTGGGPGTKTQTLPIYMYQQAFQFYQLGYGSALALVLLVIGAAASLIYVRILKVEI